MRVSILYCGACLCPRVRGCSMCAWRAAAGRVLIFLTARTAAKSYGHTNNTVSDRRVPPRAQTTAARQA